MFQRYDNVWAAIKPLEPPVQCKIMDSKLTLDSLGGYVSTVYILLHGDTESEMVLENMYASKSEADIRWAICFMSAYESIDEHQLLTADRDYDSIKAIATDILKKYADESPELLMKYI